MKNENNDIQEIYSKMTTKQLHTLYTIKTKILQNNSSADKERKYDHLFVITQILCERKRFK